MHWCALKIIDNTHCYIIVSSVARYFADLADTIYLSQTWREGRTARFAR